MLFFRGLADKRLNSLATSYSNETISRCNNAHVVVMLLVPCRENPEDGLVLLPCCFAVVIACKWSNNECPTAMLLAYIVVIALTMNA